LGVPSTATQAEITRAYRQRVRAHHPDTRSSQRPPTAADGLQQVLDAYAVLRDPARRANYDRRAAARANQPRVRIMRTPSGPAQPGKIRIPVTFIS
jgi:curved DNA-binding protein CbpA